MATKPTNGPLWAPNATAARKVYPSILQSEGPDYGEPFTNKDLNGVLGNMGDWIDWLSSGGEADLPTAVAATTAGESFNLEPLDLPYTQLQQSIGSLSAEISSIAMDAERFFVAYASSPGYIRGYTLDATADFTTGEEEWNQGDTALSGAENYTKIVSNGVYLGTIFDTEWKVYDVTDGSLVYSGDHGAVLNDCAITDDYFCVVGVADGSDIAGTVVDLSDGSTGDIPSWGVSLDIWGVTAVESNSFFIAAEADGSSNQIGKISRTGGFVGVDWRSTVARTIVTGARVCSNGRFAFVHSGDTGAWLVAYSVYDGAQVWESGISATLPTLVCDTKDLWLALNDIDVLLAIDPTNGGVVRGFSYPGAINSTLRPPLAANSQQVIRGIMDTGSLSAIVTYSSGLRTRRWTRESIAPHFNQATPEVL